MQMEHNKPIKIVNATAITPQRMIKECCIVLNDGKILDIGTGNIDVPGALVIDAQGQFVGPGFIDLHIHGGGGHDFMDNTVEAYLAIAECHARFGTTSMCPTTLTAEKEDLLKTLSIYEEANRQNQNGAQFIGLHLEVPYFAVSQRGAQDPKYIRNPDPAEYQ